MRTERMPSGASPQEEARCPASFFWAPCLFFSAGAPSQKTEKAVFWSWSPGWTPDVAAGECLTSIAVLPRYISGRHSDDNLIVFKLWEQDLPVGASSEKGMAKNVILAQADDKIHATVVCRWYVVVMSLSWKPAPFYQKKCYMDTGPYVVFLHLVVLNVLFLHLNEV